MSDHDLSKAVIDTIKLYHLGGDATDSKSKVVAKVEKEAIDERLVVYHRPRSMESEYFRFLKSRIEQEFDENIGHNKGRAILITGPNLGAGKTICALNLALAFARNYGGNTLFMDVDSRRAMSQKYMGIQNSEMPGFTDVLNMKNRAGQVLIKTEMFDMVYFPPGKFNEKFLDNLNGQELGVLMDNLRSRFKYIIIDAPPAFPMPEPAILAQHCDGVFIVLRAGRDGQTDLTQATEALEGSNIMGVILNAVKRTPGQRYGSYGYYGRGQ